MGRLRQLLKKYSFAGIFLALAAAIFIMAGVLERRSANSAIVAGIFGERLERRLDQLESYVKRELEEEECGWDHMEKLPEDMVIYRYEYDTLKAWHNEFPILNDEIRPGLSNMGITRPFSGFTSPLTSLDTSYTFSSIGSKWYMAKMIQRDFSTRIIAALEICSGANNDEMTQTTSYLRLPNGYFIQPKGSDSGETVSYKGKDAFLLGFNAAPGNRLSISVHLRWFALLFLLFGIFLFLGKRRTFKAWIFTVVALTALLAVSLLWGHTIQDSLLFSPAIYAGGAIWSSLGSLLLVGVYLTALVLSGYIMRRPFLAKALHKGRTSTLTYTVILISSIIGICAYCIASGISLIMNSSVSLDISFFSRETGFTFLVILVYAGLFATVLMLYQMLRSPLKRLTGIALKPVRARSAVAVALCFSLVLCLIFESFGFEKEKNRAEVWANRMAIDRDLALELQLRKVEDNIASDNFIAILAGMDETPDFIRNRIVDNYLNKASQSYDIKVSTCTDDDRRLVDIFTAKILSGTQIAPSSRFYYTYNANGHSSYSGIFLYVIPGRRLAHVLVEIESLANRENRDFLSIFNENALPFASVEIPSGYSYAKYVDERLVSYRGTYAYPTLLEGEYKANVESGKSNFTSGKYEHFVSDVAEGETIVISRPVKGLLQSISTFLLVALIAFLGMLPFVLAIRPRKRNPGNSFRRRISRSLLVTFVISLACLVGVSVRFVFERNIADSEAMISGRITTLETMIEEEAKSATSFTELANQRFKNYLDLVAKNTRSDISLYSPQGRVFLTTVPEIYDRMLVGTRMNDDAFYNITRKHQRFYRHKEVYRGKKYTALYAPIFNSEGSLVAILGTPYTNSGNIMQEAVPHSVLLIVIALLLIVISQEFISRYTGRMFGPLSQVSKMMRNADVHGLEYINYTPDDEISSLVEAYNRMVHDLSESTRQLAQNERNKAWSEMARQVAHEIKNPLTPIKLEIQRLIRLKQRNDASWSEKFDHVAGIVLEHIDMLADTANEFSTFAKLYAEEPVKVELDKILQDQIALFDNKDNIEITYMGLEGCNIMAPKPQLIRVFVNLVTNAVQAIEIMQKEFEEKGLGAPQGKILVCLRNSVKEGYYDVVVEDNGPGVKEENLEKIFQPNFTTKSGGTGLGLAICNSIIEKCEGSITYSRSFSLGGAAFTVRLPKFRNS